MTIKLLEENDVAVGVPVKWHVYDGKGRLLLKKGMFLRSLGQVKKLLSLEPFVRLDENVMDLEKISINDALSPFHHIEEVVERIDILFHEIIHKAAYLKKKLADKLMDLSVSIIELCEYDMDATIGAIHLGKEYGYTTIHPLHCAILCYALATTTGLKDRRLNTLICAALSSNLGMYELQKTLVKQNSRLTKQQKIEVEKHTMRSAILLKRQGVIDKLWIEIVLQHHEQQDGSGYPRKLSGVEFIREARILGLADRYHAMVSPRQYRDGMSPTDALKKIFQDRGKEVDEKLGAVLIKEMGIFPPGAYVKLANEELGIVVRRGEDRTRPIVKTIKGSDGRLYSKPKTRDSDEKDFRVIGLCQPIEDYKFDLLTLWDYKLD